MYGEALLSFFGAGLTDGFTSTLGVGGDAWWSTIAAGRAAGALLLVLLGGFSCALVVQWGRGDVDHVERMALVRLYLRHFRVPDEVAGRVLAFFE